MQQMREAFPWEQAPRYLLRDRDAIYGGDLVANDEKHGDGGSDYRTAIPMAKSVPRTAGGIDPARVSGPRHRVE
jgi:hypothetical protein